MMLPPKARYCVCTSRTLLCRYIIPGGSAGVFSREDFHFDVGSSMMFGMGQEGTTNLITKALQSVGKELETIPDPTQIHYHLPKSAAHPEVRQQQHAFLVVTHGLSIFPACMAPHQQVKHVASNKQTPQLTTLTQAFPLKSVTRHEVLQQQHSFLSVTHAYANMHDITLATQKKVASNEHMSQLTTPIQAYPLKSGAQPEALQQQHSCLSVPHTLEFCLACMALHQPAI